MVTSSENSKLFFCLPLIFSPKIGQKGLILLCFTSSDLFEGLVFHTSLFVERQVVLCCRGIGSVSAGGGQENSRYYLQPGEGRGRRVMRGDQQKVLFVAV